MKVKNEIDVYEVNGEKCKGLSSDVPHIIVSNHWNMNSLVQLQIDGGDNVAVLAKDLIAAIYNSQNI